MNSQLTSVESNLCHFQLQLRDGGDPSPDAFLSRHTGDQEDAMEFLDQEIIAKSHNLFDKCMFTRNAERSWETHLRALENRSTC